MLAAVAASAVVVVLAVFFFLRDNTYEFELMALPAADSERKDACITRTQCSL